jgi:glycosyltransferase involved in cell wall biosynthesis
MVYVGWLGSHPLTVGFKYAAQAWKTWRLLARERPDAVFVMMPPVFAALAVWVHAITRGVPFVIDAHTAAFLHPRWSAWLWLQRILARRAATTIVSNEHLARIVRQGGGRATLVPDVPVIFGAVQPVQRSQSFVVAVVCSFNYDEPIAEILEAARSLPTVRFLMTGDPRRMGDELKRLVPDNVTLTGFLSDAEYGGLLMTADAVMTLTTRDHTMLRGAYESVYQGTPVIVSDWPVLRAAFDEGAVHVNNSPAAIIEGVRRMQSDAAAFRAGAIRLRDRKLERWSVSLAELRSALTARA